MFALFSNEERLQFLIRMLMSEFTASFGSRLGFRAS